MDPIFDTADIKRFAEHDVSMHNAIARGDTMAAIRWLNAMRDMLYTEAIRDAEHDVKKAREQLKFLKRRINE